eukprot:CAMPEP_0172526000 /NCGR_PEP_ID=MMETSP1067-20121228/1016_1 /TAXON_ID=265564 ORGANISM="Thalassiosira punctigera, Strain Tpunct2005C2" /NCGR_SAMPLE_ID=MMETSP1067 /ASSEMBLY_ACC=CAM_ASM_000444 /LENGTH=69 /DNA_ID=CAMNT_0013309411 /DNA_START=86 /DNA_END=292 /DNA_ORIENTATION=+
MKFGTFIVAFVTIGPQVAGAANPHLRRRRLSEDLSMPLEELDFSMPARRLTGSMPLEDLEFSMPTRRLE